MRFDLLASPSPQKNNKKHIPVRSTARRRLWTGAWEKTKDEYLQDTTLGVTLKGKHSRFAAISSPRTSFNPRPTKKNKSPHHAKTKSSRIKIFLLRDSTSRQPLDGPNEHVRC